MIRHLALFNLKSEMEESEKAWLMDRIRGFGNLPSVKSIELGQLLNPREPWYTPRMTTEFHWLLTIEFEDEARLYQFQTDRYHLDVAREIRQRATTVKVMDFTTG